jgi:murein DD-endopeptidase MepM/ murein hydrolase activator NlpD
MTRRTIVAGLLVLGLGACAPAERDPGEAAAGRGFGAPGLGRETSLPEPEPVVAAPDPLVRRSAEVRRGEPLAGTLRRLDLLPETRDRVVRAIGREADLRRILPGETLEVALDGAGELREAVLVRDPRRRVVARFAEGEEPVVEAVERKPEVFLRLLGGELDGSLYEAMLAAGSDANLTMRYADLLAWQVDFLTEPRAGDRFRILVYQERLDGETLGYGKILAAEYRGERASARAVRWTDPDGELDWYDDDGKSVRRAFLKSPLNFRRISSRYSASRRHPILKVVRPHWGVDYAAPRGTPVSALGDGIVTFAGRKGGYGNYVEVRHNSTYTTCYGHLWKFAKGVRKGTRVTQGEVIGYVGSTGLSTGPHLDFRVKRHGGFVDPLRLDSPPGRALTGEFLRTWEAHRDRVWRLADLLAPGQAVPVDEAWEIRPPLDPRSDVVAILP